MNALLAQLVSERPEIRLISSMLLRKILCRDTTTVWENLSAACKEAVQNQLMSVLGTQLPKNFRRKVCDTIAGLTEQPDVDTSALLPKLLDWAMGQNEFTRLSGLLIMAALCKEVIPGGQNPIEAMIQGQFPVLLTACGQNMGIQSPEFAHGRVAALDLFTSLSPLIGKQHHTLWHQAIPNALQMISDLLNQGKENECRIALQHLISVAEVDIRGAMLKPVLPALIGAMAQIAAAQGLDDSVKNLALEFLLTICSNAPVACRKLPNFADTVFSVAVSLMLDVEEDLQEWNEEDPNDDDNIPENYQVGEEALDRMAIALRWKAIKGACQSLMTSYLNSEDWKQRHAALMALSQIGEVVPEEELVPFVQAILQSFADPHPRVRWAAINGIGQLSSDFGPFVQNNFHQEVIPRLIACMGDNANPRVQAHASSAVVNFAEHLEPELLMPHLDTILTALQTLLQSPNLYVQEHTLPALASIADVAEARFAKYYDSFMPYLKHVLSNAHNSKNGMMRAKAIECISLIGVSVGKEVFYKDAMDIVP